MSWSKSESLECDGWFPRALFRCGKGSDFPLMSEGKRFGPKRPSTKPDTQVQSSGRRRLRKLDQQQGVQRGVPKVACRTRDYQQSTFGRNIDLCRDNTVNPVTVDTLMTTKRPPGTVPYTNCIPSSRRGSADDPTVTYLNPV